MKAFISQPMNGKTSAEILEERKHAEEALAGYEIADSFFQEEFKDPNCVPKDVENIPIWFLAKGINVLSKCDVAYFCDGWKEARGCRIEHEIAEAYGLKIIEA